MKLTLLNKRLIQTIKCILLACYTLSLASCAGVEKYSFERIGYSNYQFQSGNFTGISQTYEEAIKEKDRNYALWNNQLGSIYLAERNYDKALDAFLKAYYLMNDIPAFKNLERGAIGLAGSEENKAYKGDPYERSMNSLYVGLLLYDKGDLENAMAAFKNGILVDSESKGEVYKSDIAALYLLASRVAKKRGDESMSAEYRDAVKELYNNPNYSILGFNDELMQRMLDLKNNVILVIEFGEGPFKTRLGQYGELAVVQGHDYSISTLNIKIDGRRIDKCDTACSVTNVYFQASTRGGRKMDSILKGKAQFKGDSARTAVTMLDLSNQFINQGNQIRAANPYADTSGYAAAAALSALFAGGAAIASAITNPKADIRCWSLLPQYIVIFPLYAAAGQHKIDIEFSGGDIRDDVNDANKIQLSYKLNTDIQKGRDSVIFKRILRRVGPEDTVNTSAASAADNKINDNFRNKLIHKGMNFSSVEQQLGPPANKVRDTKGMEIWYYPYGKSGAYNEVVFVGGRVYDFVNQPVKSRTKPIKIVFNAIKTIFIGLFLLLAIILLNVFVKRVFKTKESSAREKRIEHKRSRGVTLLAWFIITTSVIGLFGNASSGPLNSKLSIYFYWIILPLSIISGIFILKLKNWARVLTIFINIAIAIESIVTLPGLLNQSSTPPISISKGVMLLISLLCFGYLFAVILFFTRPRVKKQFK